MKPQKESRPKATQISRKQIRQRIAAGLASAKSKKRTTKYYEALSIAGNSARSARRAGDKAIK